MVNWAARQPDGDVHVKMRLDSGATMRLEIVPADQPGCTPGEPVRFGVCTGAHIAAPAPRSVVFVTGPEVIDRRDGGVEIHPVWKIAPG
jgi:hypothetical protein